MMQYEVKSREVRHLQQKGEPDTTLVLVTLQPVTLRPDVPEVGKQPFTLWFLAEELGDQPQVGDIYTLKRGER